jgi:hypothetical protein
LSEWPHRGTGTEEEFEAREALSSQIAGEPGVFMTEEGFFAPATYLPFLWTVTLTEVAMLGLLNGFPLLALFGSLLSFISYFLFMDWRKSPMVWWWSSKITANLVSSKGEGSKLVILMAHIDSAPASFAYRRSQVKNFSKSIYGSVGLFALPPIFALFAEFGFTLPGWLLSLIAALLLISVLLASIDYWRFGFTHGANDNLTGVAAATAAASNLWREMPEDTEVRLVITSAEEGGMLGAQHYYDAHREELHSKHTMVVNIDTVGYGKLSYVRKSGSFTPVTYPGILHQTAKLLAGTGAFPDIRSAVHKVGDFDSVWFARAGIPSLTLAAYDANGLMPYIHTPEDTVEHVDYKLMESAAGFAETIIRSAIALETNTHEVNGTI